MFLLQKYVLQEKLTRPVEQSDFVNFFLFKRKEHFAS